MNKKFNPHAVGIRNNYYSSPTLVHGVLYTLILAVLFLRPKVRNFWLSALTFHALQNGRRRFLKFDLFIEIGSLRVTHLLIF